MTPEVWETIREDWRQSLPDILEGRDDVHYPYGWAQSNLRPTSVTRTANYIAWVMRGPPLIEILNCKTCSPLNRQKAILYVLLRERFPRHSVASIAQRLRKNATTVAAVIDGARKRMRRDRDFLARYEELRAQL